MKLLYLASLRETLGRQSEEVTPPGSVENVDALVAWLRERGEPWSVELAASRRWRVAVNHEVAEPNTSVKAGDEIAFFPPVTGG
jgi:sulfur-carrier protein